MQELLLERSGVDDEESTLVTNDDDFDGMLVARITAFCGASNDPVLFNPVLIDTKRTIKLLKKKDLKNCRNPSSITIEFFMVIEDIDKASDVYGIGFQFESGEGPGSFQLETKDTTGDKTPVPIYGSTAPNSFVAPEFTDGSGSSFINIDQIDPTWDASLSISQVKTVFDLSAELGSPNGAVVGVAEITLGGYSGHPEYCVEITFEDAYRGIGDNSFNLKHEAIGSYIPFSLFLAGDEITNGEPFIWPSLGFAPISNQKNLIVKVNY